ncbi:amidase domain-containing protein [Streptomyces sp. NPDC059918]|uniref:amidase domain-containing protein n=1 Tax=unclassified Streptomyces TaxID=2593676 RepID=UPI00366022A1
MSTNKRMKAARTTAALALAAAVVVVTGGTTAFAAVPVAATERTTSSSTTDSWRETAVGYADTHWNWTVWNSAAPAAKDGDYQPDFQCAEFVARALAKAGLVPGLAADDPQDAYYHYKAPNGKEYDLLLISDVAGYNSLYDFLKDFGLGTDIGNHPELAQPGDVVVTFDRGTGQKLHTGLIAQAAQGTAEPTVDAHNKARYRYGYHNYDVAGEAHVIRITPPSQMSDLKVVPQPYADPNRVRRDADPAPAL